MNEKVEIDGGSFRDPSGFVFEHHGEVYRAIDVGYRDLFEGMQSVPQVRELLEGGSIVGTKLVDPDSSEFAQLKGALPELEYVLHHERVPLISYPYEWTFSMLADAAKLQLDLQIRLLEHGFSLKDASSFNIQFVGTEPIFIDLTSIEKPVRSDVWVAYGQFCRMYLFPLLLKLYGRSDTRSYLMANIDGLEVSQVLKMFGLSAIRPALCVDVFLQGMLHKLGSKKPSANTSIADKVAAGKGSNDAGAQILNLKRLRYKLDGMAKRYKGDGLWVRYEQENTYAAAEEDEKKVFVESMLRQWSPSLVLDIGCNTGLYSMLAASLGCSTVAVDSDHDSVDFLYRRAKPIKNLLPLWLDICNPSPSLGFCSRERRGFLTRMNSDCVLCLALIHHLLVTARVPLENICEFLCDLTQKYLIIEYVAVEDQRFRDLLLFRNESYSDFTRERFLSVFERSFDVIECRELGDTRAVYAMRRRIGSNLAT